MAYPISTNPKWRCHCGKTVFFYLLGKQWGEPTKLWISPQNEGLGNQIEIRKTNKQHEDNHLSAVGSYEHLLGIFPAGNIHEDFNSCTCASEAKRPCGLCPPESFCPIGPEIFKSYSYAVPVAKFCEAKKNAWELEAILHVFVVSIWVCLNLGQCEHLYIIHWNKEYHFQRNSFVDASYSLRIIYSVAKNTRHAIPTVYGIIESTLSPLHPQKYGIYKYSY